MDPAIRLLPDHLICSSFALYRSISREGLFVPAKGRADHNGTVWHNPDNLAYGALGNIYFAVELYRHTADQQLWKEIDTALSKTATWCSAHPTRNYAWLVGRSGLAFLYIRLFAITKDESFLVRTEKLLKEYWSACTESGSVNDHHHLASGTAGILMCCLQLLKEKLQPWLYEAVNGYAQTLMEQAIVSDEGIYWTGPGPARCRNTGWAYGSAGIGLVLLQAGALLHNTDLLLLANRVLQYEDPLHPTCRSCPNSQGLISGSPGADLVRLYAGRLTGNTIWEQGWVHTAGIMEKMMVANEMEKLPPGLYNGTAGFGLAFCNAYALTGNRHYLDWAHVIGTHLSSHGTAAQEAPGLFFGVAGIGLLLLQLIEPDAPDPFFFPALNTQFPLAATAVYAGNGTKEPVNWAQVNRTLLEKHFKQTYPLVQSWYPGAVQDFLEESRLPSTGQVIRFVQLLDKEKLSGENQLLLQRSLDKDCFVMQIKQGRGNAKPADDDRFVAKIEKAFSLDREGFQQLRVKVSADIDLLYQEDAIDLQQPLSPHALMHLFTGYGTYSYFFRMNQFNNVEGNTMEILRIFADLFTHENRIKDILDMLVQLVMSQKRELLTLLMKELGAGDYDHLPQLLQEKALECIRTGLMMGLLEHNDNTYLNK